MEITPGTTAGSGSIGISYNNKSASVSFTVGQAQTQTISTSVSVSPATISVGGTATATVTVTGATAGTDYDAISWSTGNTYYASFTTANTSATSGTTFTNNTLKGNAVGNTTVIATLYKNGQPVTATSTNGQITVNTANPASLVGSPAAGTVYLDNWTNTTGTGYQVFYVTPYLNGSAAQIQSGTTPVYTWTLNGSVVQNTSNNAYFDLTPYNSSLHYGNQANTLKCNATFYAATTGSGTMYSAEISWTIYTGYNNYLASVSVPNSYTYALGDRDDAGNSSIVDQLASRYYNASTYNYGLAYVEFLTTSHTYGSLNANTYTDYYPGTTSTAYTNYLGNVVFTPSGSAGKAVFSVRVWYYTGANQTAPKSVDGSICIDTGGTTSTGDVSYAANIGDTQYFNAADFENLYYDRTNGGSLTYVTFSAPSSGTGTLYADGGRLSSGTPCYVSPSSRQTALDSVYFTPSGTTATRAGTVRIGFTAYGTGGRYTGSRTITGTVVINYLNGNAKDITYTPVGGTINLKASDFTDKYREVVGSTAPTDLTIQFQDVPSNGSLSYKNSSNSSSSVSLRSSNIKSYRFTTRTSGANQIGDVTYTASGTRSDTISYIAYSGGTARFSGKVVFNPSTVSTTLTVTLVSSTSAGVDFNASSFTMANATVMASCSQIRFTVPTSGTLTYAGTAVGYAGVTVPVSMLGQIHYKPNAGFNNSTDRVAFICYDAAGNQIGSGQVNIVVSGNNTSTPGTGGVTSIGGFTDLPKAGSGNDWYFTELSSLVSRGIVQGTGNGKAEPRGKLTYGQALKMILLAAKYPAQTEVPGNDWAINYKNLAVQNGLISSSVVLTDYITRDAVAELAAKALKVQPVTGNSPFKDSTNGYAIALNRTSPQILKGDADGNFRGSSTLIRSEAWVIIYRMYEYADNQSSTQMPDGI